MSESNLNYFPKVFTNKAIQYYIASLLVCNLIFFKQFMPLWWWAFGIGEVLLFYNFSNKLSRTWQKYSPKKFEKKIFQQALVIRLVWVVFSYFFFQWWTGKPFEFGTGDAFYYNNLGNIHSGGFPGNVVNIVKSLGVSDSGYIIYLSFLKRILGQDIIITRMIKAVLGSYTCVLIYRLATRTFNEEVARIAAIFCLLMPNLIYYCGLHLKEVEMVFLTVLFLERTDNLIRAKSFNFAGISVPLVVAVSLFFLRTPLGATAFFAFFTSLMFSTTKMLGMGKRMVLIIWSLGLAGYFLTGQITSELETTWSQKDSDQAKSMAWRAKREDGNKFSNKIGAVVFAPLIVAIPFPTVVYVKDQENQMILNGGNFVKNVLAFFTIFSLILILRVGKWRNYLLVGSFFLSYLVVLAFSSFAQSERFHQPVMPLLLMFAAYGISMSTNKVKKYYGWYLIFLFVVIIGWSWFKLAGRGLA